LKTLSVEKGQRIAGLTGKRFAIMTGKVACFAFLFLSATALRADVFNFSFSGNTVSTSGTVTATDVVPGVYKITNISGTQNGVSFSMTGSGNTLVYNGGSATGTFDLMITGVGMDVLSFAGNTYSETGATGANSGTNFRMASSVPEASTASLLLAMGLGVWILARKFPSRKRSGS
jgi:hypothetical protein